MTKKISKLQLVFIIFLTMSACCDDPLDFSFNVNKIEINNTYQFRNIGDGITVNQQGYRIKLFLNEKTVKDISDLNDLSVSLGRCEQNFIGLNKDIVSLSISCDKDIWNVSAGIPLDNNNIRIYENKFPEDSQNKRLTIQEWLNFINNEDQLITFEWFIEFNEPIISTEYLKFRLQFEVVDGSEYIVETGLVKIE